jgi:ferredoxin-type protein NapF
MAEAAVPNRSRRALLRGRPGAQLRSRPPWALAEADFVAACTRCDACIGACPESILTRGDGGFPVVDFSAGECTFCGDCVSACAPRALCDAGSAPWFLKATVEDACLALHGVHCQACRDACPTGAIGFALRPGVPRPRVESDLCTGCGACVAPCPVEAMRVRPPAQEWCA